MSTAEKPTVELEKPPAWAIAMAENQAKGLGSIDSRLGAIETTVDTLVEDKQVSNQRMTRMENRLDKFEERADQSSMRAKEPSTHDLEAKAEIANERAAREALAKKVDSIETKTDAQTAMLEAIKSSVVDEVKGFFKKHPQVSTGLVGLALSAIAYATAWFQARGH